MERAGAERQDLASRDVVSRSMTIEIREGRGVGAGADHITCTSSTSGPRSSSNDCRASPRPRASSPASTSTGADPGAAHRALQHGRHPCNFHGEVVTLPGNPDSVVPGLMAVGEAACVSVHGANRLGSNSLLDLVVFGREASRH
ncbi:MAG: FAD-binding protein [Steroidobacteraceae bacterium]